MTELGIPVFNTPGANANAVKELVLCGMLLGSRRIVDGVNHMKELGKQGLAKERVEKDKAMFGGQEVRGKTLAVIGLGKFKNIMWCERLIVFSRLIQTVDIELNRSHWFHYCS